MPQKKAVDIAPISKEALEDFMRKVWHAYPKRDTPHLYAPARRAIAEQLAAGATEAQLLRAAAAYAQYVAQDQTPPKYVKSLHLFYKDEMWRAYDVPTVYGLTRDAWARSGRDVTEFDTLSAATHV